MGSSSSRSNSRNRTRHSTSNANTKQRDRVRNPPSDSFPILLPAKHSFRVNLFLVDVSKQVRDDPDGSHLRHHCLQTTTTKTKQVGGNGCWETACSSATFLKQAADNDSDNDNEPPTTPNEVQRQVLRFFKTNDKYLAYVSMLFKSRAFHEVYNDKLLVELASCLAVRKHKPEDHEHGGGERDEQEEDSNNDNNNNDYNNVHYPGVGRTIRNERPIVDLPRTEYRKPYIPLPKNWRTKAQTQTQERSTGNHRTMVKEEDIFSLSISHQFPFVGMAEITTATTRQEEDPAACRNGHRDDVSSKHKHSDLISTANENATTTTTTNETVALTTLLQDRLPPPIVGLDIVVFDELNPRLYSSPEEFLEVFRDQFTENEWNNSIQNPKLVAEAAATTSTISATPKMKEFYLRWAMKEAYTKALGVGMGLEFNTFEIHLEEIDDDENDASTCKETSLLGRITETTHGGEISLSSTPTASPKSKCKCECECECKCFRGRIQFTNQRKDEYFCFYFLPLMSSNYAEVAAQVAKPTPIIEGCACVCVGSFRGECVLEDNNSINNNSEWKKCIDTSWTDIETLVQFHRWNQSSAIVNTVS